jgi:flagellar protein FlaG
MAMKIESVSTVPIETIRIENVGVASPAITRTSPNRNTEVTQPRESFQKEKPSAEEIHRDVEAINAQLESMNMSIQFSVDKGSKDVVIKIVDKNSGEVIRQIPSAEMLRLRENMTEMVGLIVKETV